MRKKILLAFDSFKGSLTSEEAGEAAARAVRAVSPEFDPVVVPVSDGGEGLTRSLVHALEGCLIRARAQEPTGAPIEALYGISGDTAIIEVAEASGLTLVPKEKRNPLLTTSYGTGMLIRDALRRGCRKFIIGLGGSATNDAGTGMLRALGWRFTDRDGREVGPGGAETGRIASIDDSQVIPEVRESAFIGACDVGNPLTGGNGASYIFGPQKGADSAMCGILDSSLASFARIVAETVGEDLSDFPGAGAAGGIGFALKAFLNARLQPGIDIMLDSVGFDEMLDDAALVITGEGKLDAQTCMGKAPLGVLRRALKKGVPVIALGGSVNKEALPRLLECGFKDVIPIQEEPFDLAEAMKPGTASENIGLTVGKILKKQGP